MSLTWFRMGLLLRMSNEKMSLMSIVFNGVGESKILLSRVRGAVSLSARRAALGDFVFGGSTRSALFPMKSRNAVWTTRDGDRIKVKNMDDIHLHNTIKYLERRAHAEREEALHGMYMSGGMINGEMAEMDYDRILNNLEESGIEEFLDPIHEAMVLERDRRLEEKKKKAESFYRLCP